MLAVDENRCVGCGLCVTICPREAMKAWGVCQINREECNDCLVCVDYCPVDALAVLEESKT